VRTTVIAVALSVFVIAACGPTALRPEASGSSLSFGGGARRVETLTDLEEIRGVVVQGRTVFVGTDGGLFRHDAGGPGELVEGLEDIRGLVEDEGGLLVATRAGLVQVDGGQLTPIEGSPQIGEVVDMARATDGTLWLCGLGGLARRPQGGAWEIFGEPVRCTTLAPTPEGQLWVGSTTGLWYVEGEVIREHPISGGIPEGYVRSVVPVLPGQIFAIVQGPSTSQLAFWDGERWYGYTIRGLEGQAVSLVRRGADVMLVSEQRVIALAPRGQGVPLVALSNSQGNVRSFRARTQPAADYQPGELPSRDILEEPMRLAEVPESRPSVEAPGFRAIPLDIELPGRAYDAFVQGADGFIAIANGGLLHLPAGGSPRVLRTMSLVPEGDLQIATDAQRVVWAISREGYLAKLVNGRLRRVRLPEGHLAQAVANGPRGAYLVTRQPSAGPNVVHVFTNGGRGWNPVAQRTLEVPTELVSIPFAGVGHDGRVWLAVRMRHENGTGERVRGAAVIDVDSESVTYHHRGADRESGGLPLPDEISAVDFDTDNAWFASLSGLVRVGASQAVVFGEARGVRGEVVSDVAVGSNVIWLTAAEGLGSYDRTSFGFSLPPEIQAARPTNLALDQRGDLWATSSRGLIHHEGEEWTILDSDDGLPDSELRDVEVDETGRVWLLTEDRVMLFER
jgi:hypothetical protein